MITQRCIRYKMQPYNVALWDAAAVISRAVVRTSDVATLMIFPVLHMKHGAYYVSTAYFSDEGNY